MFFAKWFQNTICLSILLVSSFSVAGNGQTSPSPFKFNLAPRIGIGLNTTDISYADLDQDGFLDIAVVNGGQGNPSPTVTIRFGASGGEFGSPIVIPSYGIGQTIAAGDLNHDGMADLVVASWYQNWIAVFLNQGNRQFAPPFFSIPPAPVSQFFDVAIADFDGDGNKDVVALQGQVNQQLRFFHFSGQGLLTVFATLNQLETGTSYERILRIGDVNGDNRQDVVFAGGGPFGVRNISFVFGQSPGGTLALTWGFGVDDKSVGIDISDVDNDGDNDLVVAFSRSLQVFRNYGGAAFTPLPKMFLESPFPPTDITTDDFNNDGKRDIGALIGSVYDSGLIVMVMNGVGDGTFIERAYYATSSSSSIFSTDLDHDGKIDILTASSFLDQTNYTEDGNTVSILINDNFQRFKAPLVTLWGPNFIDAGDFNSDGYKDLVSSWATDFSTSGVDILINDKAGGLLPEVHHPSPAWLKGMKTGDFNGDGKSDAFSIHRDNTRGLAAYLGNGNGSIAAPVLTQFTRGLVNIIVGDFNSDGRDDVFVIDESGQGYSMLSNGNGTFAVAPGSPVTFPINVPYEPQKGDFNGDNKTDLVITMDTTVTSVKLWLGDGTGRFVESSVTVPPMIRTVSGDWNGDGKLDLAGMANDGIRGVLGDGYGGFGAAFYRPIEGTYSINLASSLVSADFDLDGSDEVAILMSDNYSGNLIIMQYDGSGGTPSWKQPVFFGAGPASRTWGGMLLATDFNADGKPDIAYLGANARGVIYNTIEAPNHSPFDFDGDSKTDISVFRQNAGNAEWWINRSQSGTVFATVFGLATDIPTPGDFTGDGKADIAIFRPSSGQWFILRSEDLTFLAFPFGQNGDIPAPADYDNDGKTDAAVFRSGTWFISQSGGGGTLIAQFGTAGDQPVPADYDNDGKADIAIARSNGGNKEWWIQRSTAGILATVFGSATDKTVQGDWTGDGKADAAVWRASTGQWFILRSEDLSFLAFPFGQNGDTPVPGDYDGDGRFDAGVFRPSVATWFVSRSGGSGTLIAAFGAPTDTPVPSVYVR